MDLLLIARKIWRYKLATLPVIFLTLCGAVYAVAVKDPVYEVKSSYLLINPPAPPTAEEIARNPQLGRVNADNPYTRYADQSVVVEVLTSALNSDAARRELKDAGADSRYTVASTSELGYSSPIVEITGVGASPQAAIRTAEVVGDALKRELDRMQKDEGVASDYLITTQQVEPPTDAQLRASSQARTLVAVLALGGVLLFVVVSVADALTNLRIERRERAAWDGPVGDGETWAAGPWPPRPEPDYDAKQEGSSNGDPVRGDAAIDLFPDRPRGVGRLGQGRGAGRLPDDDA
jgi:hypothetical protein